MTGRQTEVQARTPYALVTAAEPPRPASKRELVRISRELERAALGQPPPAVAAVLQDVRHLSDRTRTVYSRLAEQGAHVRLHGRGLQAWLAPGVVGVALDDDDPLVDEWAVVVPGPLPVAFAATDLGTLGGADADRAFLYAVSRDPQVVADCARALGVPPAP